MSLSRTISSGWGIVALLAAVCCARADLPALRTADAIILDGRLDEAAWAKARPTADFVGPLQPDGRVLPAKAGTRVRALWSETTLYLAFDCDGAPAVTTLRERDAELHTEEVLEVFLDFSGRGTDYFELQVSPSGVAADLFHRWPQRPTYSATHIDEAQRRLSHSDRGWTLAGMRAATARRIENGVTTGWTAEIALPVASLTYESNPDARLIAGQAMRANFAHYRYDPATASGGRPVLRQATWFPVLHGRPHISPMAMGAVRCVEDMPVSALEKNWRDAARLLVQDAHRDFAKTKPATRESRLGEALTLLNVQPRTDSNVERAAQTLTQIASEDATDDFGLAARYHLGRIEQVHRFTANPARALEIYERLMRDQPGSLYAQLAGVKACVLRLYAVGAAGVGEGKVAATARLAKGEELASFFTLAEAKRDYHLAMSDAYARLAPENPRLLAHLLAADEAAPLVRTARADLYVRIVAAAEEAGRTQLAIDYCRKFLALRTRAARVALVEERLRALEAAP